MVVWTGSNADEVGTAVADVMSCERFRSATSQVSEEISAMPAPSTAAAILSEMAAASSELHRSGG
jgi:UDP:flavonoid glycosyltransferase YjiC (YdhE family)